MVDHAFGDQIPVHAGDECLQWCMSDPGNAQCSLDYEPAAWYAQLYAIFERLVHNDGVLGLDCGASDSACRLNSGADSSRSADFLPAVPRNLRAIGTS